MAVRETIEVGLRWIVGNGRSVKIWCDKWLPSTESFRVTSPQRLCAELERVDQLIDSESGMWKADLIRKTFLPFDAEKILSIPLRPRLLEDTEVLVKQINLYVKLSGHEGCVNDVDFNSTGDLLVSGSDDKQVIFWNWETKTKQFSYPSGHLDNKFQTRIIPFTDDQKIVTSSSDGQVRLGQVLEDGRVDTKICGEDSFVRHFDLRSRSATKLFCCSSLTENSKRPPKNIRLNAIVIDPGNPNYIAVGGSDEYACVYDLRKCQLNASSNLDRPVNTLRPTTFTSQGCLTLIQSHRLTWAIEIRRQSSDRHVVNHLAPHPHIPILATCGIEKNVKLWAPMASDAPPMPANAEQLLSLASFTHPQVFSFYCFDDKQRHTLKGDTAELILRVMKKMSDMDCQMVIHLCGEGFIGNSTECNVG
ncbi:hypothetical protein CMV_014994 [Castanea mollissima]|uniref:Uncharacterized protein n=1 Tax=Castanea mollissima TaxID=60419 RepID=A0A8J4QW92_9ROSI|nr:hypothetical protein CMV_014994 [Castanea mollissima]